MELSVVIPLLNESESIRELHQWITKSLDIHKYKYEIIFVDDGSNDNSWEIIYELSKKKQSNTWYFYFQKTLESLKL